jgi:hypothetical protein
LLEDLEPSIEQVKREDRLLTMPCTLAEILLRFIPAAEGVDIFLKRTRISIRKWQRCKSPSIHRQEVKV